MCIFVITSVNIVSAMKQEIETFSSLILFLSLVKASHFILYLAVGFQLTLEPKVL